VTVGEIMIKQVVTIDPYDNVSEVKRIFSNVRFHHLLVLEKEKLIGVVSDRDYLKAISPFINTDRERSVDRASLKRKVHQIMSRKPLTTVGPDTSIEAACHLLLKHNISCLPVINDQEKIEGIITWKDLLKHFMKAK